MNPFQICAVAARALLRNTTRSFLTTLGVIIGVGAVIAMTAIGAGVKARVEKAFESMGSRMLVVRSGSSRAGGVRGGAGSQPTITWDDMGAIRDELPAVERVAPVLQSRAQVMAEGQNWNTSVQGTTPDYLIIREWPAASGMFFTDAEVATSAKVAVLGKTVVDNLFGLYADPIGQIVRVNNVPFEVIGVAASKGQSGFGGDNDDVVFVPETTYRNKLQGGEVAAVAARARAGEREAFRELIELTTPRIYRLALRVRGDPDEADDVVQETYIRAWGRLEELRDPAAAMGWLSRVARNAARDRLRWWKRRKRESFDEAGAPLARLVALADTAPLADEALAAAETGAAVARAVEALPDKQRVACSCARRTA